MENNHDVLASAGVADATPIDTFMQMQGRSIFIMHDDIFGEAPSNLSCMSTGDLLLPACDCAEDSLHLLCTCQPEDRILGGRQGESLYDIEDEYGWNTLDWIARTDEDQEEIH